MTTNDLARIIDRCEFPPWIIVLGSDCDRPYLQVKDLSGKCNVTGESLPWAGRKWFLSLHMTETEVVKTALKAVLSAVEHETLEKFTYRGDTIFDPHISVDALRLARTSYALDGREQ